MCVRVCECASVNVCVCVQVCECINFTACDVNETQSITVSALGAKGISFPNGMQFGKSLVEDYKLSIGGEQVIGRCDII